MKKNFLVLSFLVMVLFFIISCSKNNEEELATGTSCETNNMAYNGNIKPILQNSCYSCHGMGSSQGGITLDSYAGVKAAADNGKLVGAITHAAGFVPMPQNGPKLSDCNINKIKAWVNSGAPNN